jgi:two-component system response regulator AtoC
MEEQKIINIAIVEDNVFYSSLLASQLRTSVKAEVATYYSGEEFLKTDVEDFDVIVLDLNFDSDDEAALNGQQILKILNDKQIMAKVVILSAEEDIETAVDVLNIGAVDYIVKNEFALEKLLKAITAIEQYNRLTKDLQESEEKTHSLKKGFFLKALILGVIILISYWLIVHK